MKDIVDVLRGALAENGSPLTRTEIHLAMVEITFLRRQVDSLSALVKSYSEMAKSK